MVLQYIYKPTYKKKIIMYSFSLHLTEQQEDLNGAIRNAGKMSQAEVWVNFTIFHFILRANVSLCQVKAVNVMFYTYILAAMIVFDTYTS